MELLQIYLLGQMRFFLGKQPYPFKALPKAKPLLAYLLLNRDAPIRRESLAFKLWPDVTEKQAKARLRPHLYDLRQALPPTPDMDQITQFFSQNWIILVVVGSLLLFIGPWLFVWRYRAKRRELLANGRPAQAKILEIKPGRLTFGTSSSPEGGNVKGVNFLLEVYPDGGQLYQVKSRDQLHLLDIPRVVPGMMVPVKVDPNNPQHVAVDFKGNQ